MSAQPQNSYAKLVGRFDHLDESDGVTWSLTGPSMKVPLSFYRKVVHYVVGLPMGTHKNMPNVSDPKMFVESLLLMIIYQEDRVHGFELLVADHPDIRWGAEETCKAYLARIAELPKYQPGKDYIPAWFTKGPQFSPPVKIVL